MDFFSKLLDIKDENLIKEGWLVKESKFRKVWREYLKKYNIGVGV